MDMKTNPHQLSLEWLLDPIPLSTFLAEYWEQKPLYIARDRPDYYSGLMSLADLDTLIGSTLTNSGIRTAKGGQASAVGMSGAQKTTLAEFYDLYYQGSTVVVQDVHLRWPPIDALGALLSKELGCTIGTHLYPTPKGYQGFGTHWDDHDIFALQLEGEKEWTLSETGPKLPRYSATRREYSRHSRVEIGEPSVTITMKAGDLLYFPKGVIHRVRSTTKASLHLTYGLYPETWERLIVEAIRRLGNKHPELGQALPLGFLSGSVSSEGVGEHVQHLLTLLRNELGWEDAHQHLAARVVSAIRPQPDGHFAQLSAARNIGADTVVRKRDGMTSTLTLTDEHVTIHFPGGHHKEPRSMEAALRYIHAHEGPLRIGDIPGELGNAGRLALVRTLVGKGVLRVAG